MIGQLDSTYRKATVVGAGISGLLAAYRLDASGYEVTLVEASARAGGLIETKQTPYGIAESAAQSFLASTAVKTLARQLELELIPIREDSRARFIYRDGRLRKFPLNFSEAFQLLSRVTRRVTADTQYSPTANMEQWARQFLGDAALDYLVDPGLSGIYASQPVELALEAAFPQFAVPVGASLFKTILAYKREQKKKSPEPAQMMTFRHGMGSLVEKLDQHLIARLGDRWKKNTRLTELPTHPNVVLTLPAHAASALLHGADSRLSESLSAIRYSPLMSVTVFYSRSQVDSKLRGVGALIPRRESRNILGILFSSSCFADRVADESQYASFTVFMGGSARPELLDLDDSQVIDLIASELNLILGIEGHPLHTVIHRWPKAIPVYNTHLLETWKFAREGWCATSGNILFGNYTGQVSLRGLIEAAEQLC